MSDELTGLSINQLTTRDQWSLQEAVNGYSRHGIRAMSVWWEKLEEIGVERAARLIRDAGMTVTGYCVGGLLTDRDPAARQARIDVNRRMLDTAASIGSPCLVVIGGGLLEPPFDVQGARSRVLDGLAALLDHARDTGIVIALEPLHPMLCASRSVLCTMRQANDWCEALGGGAEVGVVVDTYNVWWDPELEAEIARARDRIAAFHVSDWLTDTDDLRFDRGMPGDGVIDITRMREWVESAGYAGHWEVEILSRKWWAKDPDTVVQTVKDRYLHRQ